MENLNTSYLNIFYNPLLHPVLHLYILSLSTNPKGISNMITVITTANYSLTFNNDVLASAKCLLTGRFVKRSIAMTEYQYELAMDSEAVKTVTTYVVKTTVVAASKILFSASIMTTLTILFVLLFAGLFFAFFAASSGNVYAKGFLMTFITTVVCGVIGLYLLDQFNTVKNQLKAIA